MTRHTVDITTAGTVVVCDCCGRRLVVGRQAGLEGWLRGKGWRVDGRWDRCPGCAVAVKDGVDYEQKM